MYNDIMMLIRYALMIYVGYLTTKYTITSEVQEAIIAGGVLVITVVWRLTEKYWGKLNAFIHSKFNKPS